MHAMPHRTPRRMPAAWFLAAVFVGASACPDLARADAPFTSSALISVNAHPLTPQNAPADEYFGRLKLSNVGIRNIIHAIAVEGDSPLALPLERSRIMGVETAIVQWSELYPRDPWLRRAMLTFAQVLAPKHDVDTDRIAIDMLLRAGQRFADPAYQKLVDQRLRAIAPASDIDWSAVPFDPPTFADAFYLNVGRL
jgi:hypothetical protein